MLTFTTLQSFQYQRSFKVSIGSAVWFKSRYQAEKRHCVAAYLIITYTVHNNLVETAYLLAYLITNLPLLRESIWKLRHLVFLQRRSFLLVKAISFSTTATYIWIVNFVKILPAAPRISLLDVVYVRLMFNIWSDCQLEETKDKELSQHDKQSADGGCGFQFWHANGRARNLLTGSHKPVWDIWPLPSSPFRDKVHAEENQDNDRHKEALMNTSGLIAVDLIRLLCSAVKFTQTGTLMCDFTSTFTRFVFIQVHQVYETISNVLHANIS